MFLFLKGWQFSLLGAVGAKREPGVHFSPPPLKRKKNGNRGSHRSSISLTDSHNKNFIFLIITSSRHAAEFVVDGGATPEGHETIVCFENTQTD
ncbi:hypothetical protein BgiMline_016476 [Biomphalaria glabrata]|nr:hypothetical protein BgiMline_009280 [Biomphalaria glabrata]